MRKSISFIAAAFAAAVITVSIAPAEAGAHVTLSPDSAPAGSWSTFSVKVPNESDTASTVKVVLRMPEGVTYASWQPVTGWNAQIQKAKLDKPIPSEDGPITEAVSQITWTAEGRGVQPGQFQQFPITIKVPDSPGSDLTFKAIQTYSDGKVSRWIGSPESEEPAPTVSVTSATENGGHSADDGSDSSGHSDTTLSVIALVIAAVALALSAAAFVSVRRK